VNALNHATLRRAPRGRPDLAGCPPRPSVHPDGRSSKALCKNRFGTGRTAHFRAMGPQRGALTPDVRPMASTSIGWQIWPVLGCDRTQPCECYATTAQVTAAAVGVCWHHPRTEHVRLELCHQWFRTWLRFTKSLLGFLVDSARVGTPRSRRGITGMLSAIIMEPLKIDPVPLGASQIPTHKPSRRCVAVV
jgi:hypothetical protein